MSAWHIDRSEGTKIKDEGGNTVLWTHHTHLRGRRTDEEVMQIARLAAAAPELLEALHNALVSGLPEVVADQARAAISKAEAT